MNDIIEEYAKEMQRETLIRWFRVGESVERAIATFPSFSVEEIQEICHFVKSNPESASDVVTTYYEIDKLNLPTRIRNTCISHNIVTIKQLQKAYDDGTLAALRGIGIAALNIVRHKLEDPNFSVPIKNKVSLLHIQQLKSLRQRATDENDIDSQLALDWALAKLYEFQRN